MSKESVSRILFELSKTDTEILVASQKKNDIQQRWNAIRQEIERLKTDIKDSEHRHDQLKSRQSTEEERLKNEEKKIVERRKQLTALGGTKGAKLVEREIDIASRSIQTMEQKTIQAMEEVSQLAIKIEQNKTDLDAKQLELEAGIAEDEKALSEIEDKLTALRQRRDASVGSLDERIKSLYLRVSSRYTGSAIAVAENGACMSCYRSLPAQTFNQILSGNLLQCPSCSRILVTVAAENAS